jgi:hypothetical protein
MRKKAEQNRTNAERTQQETERKLKENRKKPERNLKENASFQGVSGMGIGGTDWLLSRIWALGFGGAR